MKVTLDLSDDVVDEYRRLGRLEGLSDEDIVSWLLTEGSIAYEEGKRPLGYGDSRNYVLNDRGSGGNGGG